MKKTLCLGLIFLVFVPLRGQNFHPDSTSKMLDWLALQDLRFDTLSNPGEEDIQLAKRIGKWEYLENRLREHNPKNVELAFIKLEKYWSMHRYEEATLQFDSIQATFFASPIAVAHESIISEKFKQLNQKWKAEFEILRWQLPKARSIFFSLMDENKTYRQALLGLGRIEIFEKNYLKAEALALKLIEQDSTDAEAYKLAAEANFWLRKELKAESYLQKSLTYDPLDADARFSYGYAIWRRRDANLLGEMARQWEIALKLNPLHYKTHWHWGNGHTHLTYTDYYDPDENRIRVALDKAEEDILNEKFDQGIAGIRKIKSMYPTSVIPEMYLGSHFYQESNQNPVYLDSSELVFQGILSKKPHYGPAHNGMAAVIKKRQMRALASYPSLEKKISELSVPDNKHFISVFPDLTRYPGVRVSKMVWNQLQTTTAYLPLLDKIDRTFAIPPLHEDLALAMKNSFFRGGTTFDNRQWMDIRGVGSGATGIEYVERGAHNERNVSLHEYVHLFHGVLFTDQEKREVRKLYYEAMKYGRVLDYYAANNEFEYLAQAIPAFFSLSKVHPLNHKAANTRKDLKSKDSSMYNWVEQLTSNQKAALEGDSSALAGNWAEAYLYLSNQASLKRNDSLAQKYIDTALLWMPGYTPAIVRKSQLAKRKGDFRTSRKIIGRQLTLKPENSALLLEEGKLWTSMYLEGQISLEKTIRKASQSFEAALSYEEDLMEKARLNRDARNFFMNFGLWEEGIRLAEDYILDGSEISTYLRDEKDQNRIYKAYLKGIMGHYRESSVDFERLISQKPQNYSYREKYGEVLMQLGRYDKLVELIKPSQELLKSAGSPRKSFQQLLALAYLGMGDSSAYQKAIAYLGTFPRYKRGNSWWETQLIIDLHGPDSALNRLNQIPVPKEPLQASEYNYWKAQILIELDRLEEAIPLLEQSLQALPYNFRARMSYIQLLELLGKEKEARVVAQEGVYLPYPAGDFYTQQLESILVQD
ncbi:MAG: hypothetical protein MRZ79_10790 [Bacteroidia bacterium]|nr:hypothetical protein [Bacteroidia bacterium]